MPSSPPGIVILSLAAAERIADEAIEVAEELGIKISVAVCDPGGRLVLFTRMDGAVWGSIFASQGKALASAGFNMATRIFSPESGQGHVRFFGSQGDSRDMIYLRGGGLAIFHNKVAIGSCGVPGGTDEQNEEYARAGIAKLTDYPI